MYLLVMIAVGIVIFLVILGGMGGTAIFTDPESLQGMNDENVFSTGTLLAILIVLALLIPVIAAFWFAPVLVALGGVSVMNSFKMSLIGCLKNILPFIIYGIAITILAILAIIPLGLGLLILGPVSIAVFYVAYRQIYTG